MAGKKEYETRAEAILVPIVEANQLEIYDVEYVKEGKDWYLRAYIDKPGGVTIDDCEVVSRAFSDKLDEEDFISDAYILEVSSPGLGRQLKKDRHFEKSLGERVEVKLFEAVDGQKEFAGVLDSFDKDSITIICEPEEKRTFERSKTAQIRLEIDF